MTRALLVVAMAVLSLAGTALPASAASTAGKTPGVPLKPAAAGCPTSGQRVEVSGTSAIYMIDPDGYWDHIADENVYFDLWDSWSGIAIISSGVKSNCYVNGGDFYGFLEQVPGDARVWIWDNTVGLDRWITSAAIFNKYGFAWDKIYTVYSLTYDPSVNWDN